MYDNIFVSFEFVKLSIIKTYEGVINMSYKIVFGTLLLTSLVGLSGCNTFEGAGRDVTATGDALTGAAHDSKEAIKSHR